MSDWEQIRDECEDKEQIGNRNRYICRHEDASGCAPTCMRPSCPKMK